MQKLLIIDGSNLLFQMFYGMPSRIVNKDGKAIHGTLGFVGAMLKIIRQTNPTHVVIIFDGEHQNARTETDPDYKANRPDYSQMAEEETPFSQLSDICKALTWLKIPYTETTDCETDDVIAAYALRYGRDMQVVISSFDSDFFQLITPNVSVLRYRGENSVLCDEEYIRAKFGINPSQYADFKALTGDAADNIKGVNKIGPKTASKLLQSFGDLKTLMGEAERIDKACIRASIIASSERIKKNVALIRLNACAALPFDLERLRYTYQGETTTQVLSAIGIR